MVQLGHKMIGDCRQCVHKILAFRAIGATAHITRSLEALAIAEQIVTNHTNC